ncbi:hypothetical protein GCM10009798_24190 [Nocardioides panacihumi]|uniref:Uncharacterized protein n=1 Tax=Nocardioides panacihumi TaxID=400774 RepID=A0ABN2R475_9ACTN
MSAPIRADASMFQGNVSISLTGDVALVLFDLLHRWEDEERVNAPQHVAEQIALWNLSALLERELSEPFQQLDPEQRQARCRHLLRQVATRRRARRWGARQSRLLRLSR